MFGVEKPPDGWSALILSDDALFAATLATHLGACGIACSESSLLPMSRIDDPLLSSRKDRSLVFVHAEGVAADFPQLLRRLRERIKSPLIAVGPPIDPHAIVTLMRAGAVDYLDQASNLGAQIEELLWRVLPNSPELRRGRLVTVTSASGGTGCSVVAANLAVALAKEAGSCGLLDLDLGSGTQCAMLGVKRRHTIVDLCQQLDKLDRTMVEQSFVRHKSGVHLLAGPARVADAESVTSHAVGKILDFARSLFPFVVVDGLKAFRLTAVDHLVQSDSIYMVTRLEFASLVNAKRGLEHLTAHGISDGVVQIVVNRHATPGELHASAAEGALGRSFVQLIRDTPKLINAAINAGSPTLLDAPRSPIARAVTALAQRELQSARRAAPETVEV